MNKIKRSAKEIARLRELYKSQGPIGTHQATTTDMNATVPSSSSSGRAIHSHSIVRKDLSFLGIIVIVFAILLFALNYLASTTAFGEVLGGWVSKIV